jgi:hypothetical protein
MDGGLGMTTITPPRKEHHMKAKELGIFPGCVNYWTSRKNKKLTLY